MTAGHTAYISQENHAKPEQAGMSRHAWCHQPWRGRLHWKRSLRAVRAWKHMGWLTTLLYPGASSSVTGSSKKPDGSMALTLFSKGWVYAQMEEGADEETDQQLLFHECSPPNRICRPLTGIIPENIRGRQQMTAWSASHLGRFGARNLSWDIRGKNSLRGGRYCRDIAGQLTG